ncbi:hypothetical protein [Nonomuraea sp. NPDC049695]|uniref:hypothetical protein n=1 Tax=Nonomuraea sp. NPDC049695 TaxID=3154734 RepID=UPI00342005C8
MTEIVESGASPKLCKFPGCSAKRQPRQPGAKGRSPEYCEREDHNPSTRHKKVLELARQARGEAEAENPDGPPVTTALALAPQLIADARKLQEHQDQMAGRLAQVIEIVGDPAKAMAEVTMVRTKAAHEVAAAEMATLEAVNARRVAEHRLAIADEAADFATAGMEQARKEAADAREREEAALLAAVSAQAEVEQALSEISRIRHELKREQEACAAAHGELQQERAVSADLAERLAEAERALAAQIGLREAAERMRDEALTAKERQAIQSATDLVQARQEISTQTALRERAEQEVETVRAAHAELVRELREELEQTRTTHDRQLEDMRAHLATVQQQANRERDALVALQTELEELRQAASAADDTGTNPRDVG